MKSEFPIGIHYEQAEEDKLQEQERKVEETLRRLDGLKLKAWKAGFDIKGKPILDAQTLKHYEAKDTPKKEGIRTIKFKDRMNE